MSKIRILFWFDVEDFITSESEEALLGLLERMDARGIKGVFKLVGEKARRLEEHHRTDILSKLQEHEIGYHTDMHSEHPTISEFLEPLDFRSGALEFEKREWGGLDDVERITGKKALCYGQPGGSWAPQVFPVLSKWGIPVYLDSHDQISLDGKPFWYGGVLNITDMRGMMRMELVEAGLEDAKHQFDELVASFENEEIGFISIFYHPTEFATTEFWDAHNYAHGINTTRSEWRTPPLRSKEEMNHYLDRLAEFLDYTLAKPNVRYITSEEALQLECSRATSLDASDVRTLAENVSGGLDFQVYHGISLSPSELFSLFEQHLTGKPLQPELLYGPEQGVVSDEVGTVRVGELLKAMQVEYATLYGVRQLPDIFEVNGLRVNPVDMACTLAKVIARGLGPGDDVDIVKGILKTESRAKDNDHWGRGWVIFPRDFHVPNVIAVSKLQTWTLKPALFCE